MLHDSFEPGASWYTNSELLQRAAWQDQEKVLLGGQTICKSTNCLFHKNNYLHNEERKELAL